MCHSLGLKSDGSIVAWGDNCNGECNVPVPNTGFDAIAAGTYHSLGLKSSTVTDVKQVRDGCQVSLTEAIVSAAWDNSFYLESDNRISGIRVEKTAHGLTANNARANVAGTLRTNSDGERYIEASSAVNFETGSVKPLFMIERSLWRRGLEISGRYGVA